MSSKDEFLFLKSGLDRLYGSLHYPGDGIKDNKIGYVLCQPFVTEQFKVYRILYNLCRYLADEGFTMLRFDYLGTGDSEGEFEGVDVNDWKKNVINAFNFMKDRRNLSRIGLIGCRLGSVWAALAAESLGSEVFRLALWDPVFDVHAYLYNQLRGNLSEQMIMYGKVVENREKLVERIESGQIVSVGGYEFAKGFYHSATKINILDNPPRLLTDLIVMKSASQSKEENTDDFKFLKIYQPDSNPSDIKLLPKEVNWELSKGYITFPEQTFRCIADSL